MRAGARRWSGDVGTYLAIGIPLAGLGALVHSWWTMGVGVAFTAVGVVTSLAPKRHFAALGLYETGVGVALLVYGGASRSWPMLLVGGIILGLGAFTAFGRGEATSWMRGELDERRQKALGHAGGFAFLVLAWWLAGVAVYSNSHQVATGVWTAGIAVGLAGAGLDYAWVLRRT